MKYFEELSELNFIKIMFTFFQGKYEKLFNQT